MFGRAFIWFLIATVLQLSWNYVIKDMGGRIDDAFGITNYQWQLPVLVSYSPL
jgi:hypothetical protein